MKQQFSLLLCCLSLGLFLISCKGNTTENTETDKTAESKPTEAPEEKKETVKVPDFSGFFNKFKVAVNSQDYSMIELPLFSGGLDKKALKDSDLKAVQYQQVFKDMLEMTDLVMGPIKEADMEPYLKEQFTKKYGSLNDLQMVNSSGPDNFYAYFKPMGSDYKLVGIHYVPGGM